MANGLNRFYEFPPYRVDATEKLLLRDGEAAGGQGREGDQTGKRSEQAALQGRAWAMWGSAGS